MASASLDHPLLEQLRKDSKVSNEPGYSVIKVPTSHEGRHMTKVVWPRTSFPRELHRWNLSEEILSYLISFDTHKDWVTNEIHTKPPSGTMLLYDKRKTRHYKLDGYDWKTRKHQSTAVREDRTKLKVCGHILLYALYTHCESNPSFHRRIYWLITNPSITLVHYLDISASGTCRKVTPASLKRQLTDQVCADVITGPPVDSTGLLAISDQTICLYLLSTKDSSNTLYSLKKLLQRIHQSARTLYQKEGLVTTATFITYVQKTLFPDGWNEQEPLDNTENSEEMALRDNVALFDQAMKLIQLQKGSPQQVLLPKGTTEKMASADVLRAAAVLLAQADNNKSSADGTESSNAPTLSLSSVLSMVRPLLVQTTPTASLTTRNHPLSSVQLSSVQHALNRIPPVTQAPPTPVTPTTIATPTHSQVSPDDSEYLSFIHPPSLESLKLVLPQPLDIDSALSSSSNMAEVTQFAESLLTMRPLEDAQRLKQQESNTGLNTSQTGLDTSNTSFASSGDIDMSPSDFFSDNFLDHFLDELTNGTVPPTHDNDVLGQSVLHTNNESLAMPTLNESLATPTHNGSMPTANEMLHNGLPPPTYDSVIYNGFVPPTQNDMLLPTHNQLPVNSARQASAGHALQVDSTHDDYTIANLDLDPESLKILMDLYSEGRGDEEAPLPLSPTSQYMASLNGQETPSNISTFSCDGDETSYYGNESVVSTTPTMYGETAISMATNPAPMAAASSIPMTTSSVPMPTSLSLFGNFSFLGPLERNLQFANSLLQQPPHLASSISHSPHMSPLHVPPLYRSSSPIQSPPSPSQASISSLSTAGGDSESSLVAELCELMSESPNVQQEDFSHLSLSGPEQQELLEASRVIQKTLRRCKERPNSMVTYKEKNAALLIERSYKRYRELKRRKDEAARCIQAQYRLYRRRTEELQRAALFIQQMYRYQRRRRISMSSLATHSQSSTSSFNFR